MVMPHNTAHTPTVTPSGLWHHGSRCCHTGKQIYQDLGVFRALTTRFLYLQAGAAAAPAAPQVSREIRIWSPNPQLSHTSVCRPALPLHRHPSAKHLHLLPRCDESAPCRPSDLSYPARLHTGQHGQLWVHDVRQRADRRPDVALRPRCLQEVHEDLCCFSALWLLLFPGSPAADEIYLSKILCVPLIVYSFPLRMAAW